MDAMVSRTVAALARAHELFGDPASPAHISLGRTGLAGAAATNTAGSWAASTMAGRLPDGYGRFATQAGRTLDALAAADDDVDARLSDAANAHTHGRNASGIVKDRAASDVARTSGASATPAGQRALIVALRTRVAEQRRVVAAHQARDARLAALLRASTYPRGGAGGGWSPSGGGATTGVLPAGRGGGSFGRPTPGVIQAAAISPSPAGHVTRDSGPRDCAAALIEQARLRGYSPAQTCAILATMPQESGGDLRAVSPNRLWRGLFQQDAGHPGRDDPNTAISGFLDRLAAKGGPACADIWKSIFWLQQARGAASAEAAYAGGRRGYLREIESQLGRATALYQELAVR